MILNLSCYSVTSEAEEIGGTSKICNDEKSNYYLGLNLVKGRQMFEQNECANDS